MTTRTPPHKCLNCGAYLDAATSTDREHSTPTPGALSICMECGGVSVFGDDLRLRPLTEDEVIEITGSRETMAALASATAALHFVKASQN